MLNVKRKNLEKETWFWFVMKRIKILSNHLKNQQKELFKFTQQRRVERDLKNLKLNSMKIKILMVNIGILKLNERENTKKKIIGFDGAFTDATVLRIGTLNHIHSTLGFIINKLLKLKSLIFITTRLKLKFIKLIDYNFNFVLDHEMSTLNLRQLQVLLLI